MSMPPLRHRAWLTLCLASLAMLFAVAHPAPARADILISPQRVILTDVQRQGVIKLHNPGQATRTYALEWVERGLTESGELLQREAGANPLSVVPMVRFSPRRVTVRPGETQTIRLDYRPPAGQMPGEYRSHLLIGLQPEPDGSSGTEVMRGTHEGMSFRLNALLSFAVPVFVRHGEGAAQVTIDSIAPATVERNGRAEQALRIGLTREGAFSTYGRIAVYQQREANAPVEEIGEAGGVAIYAENRRQLRTVTLKPGSRLEPGSWLRVTYEGEGAERGQVFAEQVFRVGH